VCWEAGQAAAACVQKRAFTMARAARRGKSGLHRVGWRLITARREARNRATETSLVAGDRGEGETRQPPPGATPNRQATTRPAELAGRWLEPRSNPGPRGMAARAARPAQNPAYRPAFLPSSARSYPGCCQAATPSKFANTGVPEPHKVKVLLSI